jgi:16S rRNA G966 N2-methylase RsmD
MSSSSIHITQGKYKNRKIKLPEKIHGHNEVTSQKIKESAFQISLNLIHSIEETLFIDCFCGSAQMGFEAISRGYAEVFFYDISSERISAAKRWAESNMEESDIAKCRFEKKDSVRSIFANILENFQNQVMNHDKIKNIVFFADPPYNLPYKSQNIVNVYTEQFLKLPHIENINLVLIFQTSKKNLIKSVLDKNPLPNEKTIDFFKIYEYGNNRLAAFKICSKKDSNE